MSRAQLKTDMTRAGRSNAGVLWCGLALCIGDAWFPHRDWTDFGAVVLTWWADAVSALLGDHVQEVEVKFMEGPYSVELGAGATRSVWSVRWVERGLRRSILLEAVVDARELAQSVCVSADEVLALARTQNWLSGDTAALELSLGALKIGMLRAFPR